MSEEQGDYYEGLEEGIKIGYSDAIEDALCAIAEARIPPVSDWAKAHREGNISAAVAVVALKEAKDG